MHELSVTESVLEIALRHLPTGEPARISAVHLVIGQMSSIVDDSVQFYWDIVAQGTPAEGSQLTFRRIPTEILCLDCNQQYHPAPEEIECPNCGSVHIKILSGEEFYVESMDVEAINPSP